MLFALVGTILYMFISGMSSSIIRAGIMTIISITALYFGRKSDPFWSLILAAVIMIIVDPFIISDIGFQLSMAATIGVLLSTSPLGLIFYGSSINGAINFASFWKSKYCSSNCQFGSRLDNTANNATCGFRPIYRANSVFCLAIIGIYDSDRQLACQAPICLHNRWNHGLGMGDSLLHYCRNSL